MAAFSAPPNAHNVRTTPLDLGAAGAPMAKTYHGLSIVVNNKSVGRIESWAPQMFTRGGQHLHELSHFTFGRPVDYVPGVIPSFTASATRTEMWQNEFELALGFKVVWADLIDQDRPFTIYEYLFKGKDIYRVWAYTGCWFQNRNEENMQATSDAPRYLVNAEIAFVSRVRTVG